MSGYLLYKEYITDDKSKECIKKFEKKIKAFAIEYEKDSYKKDLKDYKSKIDKINKKEKITIEDKKDKAYYEKIIKSLNNWYNNKESFDGSVNYLVDQFIRTLCNENCKSTLFEVGNKNKLSKSFLDTLGDMDLEKNKDVLKMYEKIRKKYYSGTSFTKNTLTDNEQKKIKDLGFISYCEEDNHYFKNKMEDFIQKEKSKK